MCLWVPRYASKGSEFLICVYTCVGVCVSVSWTGSSPRAGIPVLFIALYPRLQRFLEVEEQTQKRRPGRWGMENWRPRSRWNGRQSENS